MTSKLDFSGWLQLGCFLGRDNWPCSDAAFNEEAIVQPQIFAAISTDYHLPDWALTPGIQLGVELPVAVKTELYGKTGTNTSPTLIGEHTLLVRTSGERVILPEGEGRLPVISGRLTFRWYPSDMLTILAYALFAFDQNTSILQRVGLSLQHASV